MSFKEIGLKNIYGNGKSTLSTQGKNGFYRDSTPGTQYPRKGMFAYANPETGTSEIKSAPEK